MPTDGVGLLPMRCLPVTTNKVQLVAKPFVWLLQRYLAHHPVGISQVLNSNNYLSVVNTPPIQICLANNLQAASVPCNSPLLHPNMLVYQHVFCIKRSMCKHILDIVYWAFMSSISCQIVSVLDESGRSDHNSNDNKLSVFVMLFITR